MSEGTLYICATPIGNLEDITLRVLRVLREVDLIAAEDTRHSMRLLSHYQIDTPKTSYHKFNIAKKTDLLIEELIQGKSIALISDAGTPGISDPGEELIQSAIFHGIRVVPLPGPSAITTALIGSGLPTGRFTFLGFLPTKKKAKQTLLEEIKNEKNTLVFYESPHRVADTLAQCLEIIGNREGCVCREITKKFEEFKRGTLEQLSAYYAETAVKGEITVVIEPYKEEAIQAIPEERKLLQELGELIEQGMDKKEAFKALAGRYKIPKRELYQLYEKQ